MEIQSNLISYQNLELLKNNKNKKKNTEKLDINSSDYLYKFVDEILKRGLQSFKKNNRKPFKLSRSRNLVIIQFPTTYDESLYDEWYQLVEEIVNQVFYKKESDVDEIPDTYQRNRLFTQINSVEYEINGNIVIKSIPIYIPTRTKTKLKTSKENKEVIQGKGNVKVKKNVTMFEADDSDSEYEDDD